MSSPPATVDAALEDLANIGLSVVLDERARRDSERAPPSWAHRTDVFSRIFRHADAGVRFHLECPASDDGGAVGWPEDLFTRLIHAMSVLIEPDLEIEGWREEPHGEWGCRTFFVHGGREHEMVLTDEDAEQLTSAEAVGRFLDVINSALAASASRWRFVGFEGMHPEVHHVVAIPAPAVAGFVARVECFPTASAVGATVPPGTPPVVALPRLPRLEQLVPPERLSVGDAECVDSLEDLGAVVRTLWALAPSSAAIEHVECVDLDKEDDLGNPRARLEVRVAGRPYSTEVSDTGSVDSGALVELLDAIATDLDLSGHFYEVYDPDWGQEYGVAFATPDEARKLRAYVTPTGGRRL